MKLYITIDTEPDCDIHWKRSNPLTYTSITSGIPQMLRPIWNAYSINPIYFVSPEILLDQDSCNVLKNEIRQGAIIGTHLHSEFIEPQITLPQIAGNASLEFPCYAHDYFTEYQKIHNLTSLIQNKLNYHPVWYRAARYGADNETIKILSELGYTYDSSVTPGINWKSIGGPDFTKAPNQPYWIGKNDISESVKKEDSFGIMEIPITISGKRFGKLAKLLPDTWLFYKWLRPTHMTFIEEKDLIDSINRSVPDPVFTLIFHSMELMINKTPFVRNRYMQKRFLKNLERIIAHTLHVEYLKIH